jgi:hypothetical protein
MQNFIFSFFLNINFIMSFWAFSKQGRVGSRRLFAVFVSLSLHKCMPLSLTQKPANRRLICKYRLKVLIEIEQKLMLRFWNLFFKGFVISSFLFWSIVWVALLHDKWNANTSLFYMRLYTVLYFWLTSRDQFLLHNNAFHDYNKITILLPSMILNTICKVSSHWFEKN